jgi:hypothetical protein
MQPPGHLGHCDAGWSRRDAQPHWVSHQYHHHQQGHQQWVQHQQDWWAQHHQQWQWQDWAQQQQPQQQHWGLQQQWVRQQQYAPFVREPPRRNSLVVSPVSSPGLGVMGRANRAVAAKVAAAKTAEIARIRMVEEKRVAAEANAQARAQEAEEKAKAAERAAEQQRAARAKTATGKRPADSASVNRQPAAKRGRSAADTAADDYCEVVRVVTAADRERAARAAAVDLVGNASSHVAPKTWQCKEVGDNQLWCDLCNVTATRQNMNEHLFGKRHRKSLNRRRQEEQQSNQEELEKTRRERQKQCEQKRRARQERRERQQQCEQERRARQQRQVEQERRERQEQREQKRRKQQERRAQQMRQKEQERRERQKQQLQQQRLLGRQWTQSLQDMDASVSCTVAGHAPTFVQVHRNSQWLEDYLRAAEQINGWDDCGLERSMLPQMLERSMDELSGIIQLCADKATSNVGLEEPTEPLQAYELILKLANAVTSRKRQFGRHGKQLRQTSLCCADTRAAHQDGHPPTDRRRLVDQKQLQLQDEELRVQRCQQQQPVRERLQRERLARRQWTQSLRDTDHSASTEASESLSCVETCPSVAGSEQPGACTVVEIPRRTYSARWELEPLDNDAQQEFDSILHKWRQEEHERRQQEEDEELRRQTEGAESEDEDEEAYYCARCHDEIEEGDRRFRDRRTYEDFCEHCHEQYVANCEHTAELYDEFDEDGAPLGGVVERIEAEVAAVAREYLRSDRLSSCRLSAVKAGEYTVNIGGGSLPGRTLQIGNVYHMAPRSSSWERFQTHVAAEQMGLISKSKGGLRYDDDDFDDDDYNDDYYDVDDDRHVTLRAGPDLTLCQCNWPSTEAMDRACLRALSDGRGRVGLRRTTAAKDPGQSPAGFTLHLLPASPLRVYVECAFKMCRTENHRCVSTHSHFAMRI